MNPTPVDMLVTLPMLPNSGVPTSSFPAATAARWLVEVATSLAAGKSSFWPSTSAVAKKMSPVAAYVLVVRRRYKLR